MNVAGPTMNGAESTSKSDPTAVPFVPNEPAETDDAAEAQNASEADSADAYASESVVVEAYRGLDLAPATLESLVTWDVSVHARREQERLRQAAARFPSARPSAG